MPRLRRRRIWDGGRSKRSFLPRFRGRVLMLGTNLADAYPAELAEPADPELEELLARFEPVPPAIDDCGARDWSNLHQRMHYIAHLSVCSSWTSSSLSHPSTRVRWRNSAAVSCRKESYDGRPNASLTDF